ncbi:hypothetical protein BR93DRAFT_479914 [Coniochaeta sp. PMI_546]|nr:hypothetical protein BR93DRAFT_479914 [Coniochaeta sp. PMI_546]
MVGIEDIPTFSGSLDDLLYLGRVRSSVCETNRRQNSQGRQLNRKGKLHGPITTAQSDAYRPASCLSAFRSLYVRSVLQCRLARPLLIMHNSHDVAPRLGLRKLCMCHRKTDCYLIMTGRVPVLSLHTRIRNPRAANTLTMVHNTQMTATA